LSHTIYQYTGVIPVPFPPAGDNDTVVYLEEVPLQAFPMFKGIVFCQRQPKIFSPASYGIAHNCVSDNVTLLPSLNKSWINQAEAFIQPLKWKWIPV